MSMCVCSVVPFLRQSLLRCPSVCLTVCLYVCLSVADISMLIISCCFRWSRKTWMGTVIVADIIPNHQHHNTFRWHKKNTHTDTHTTNHKTKPMLDRSATDNMLELHPHVRTQLDRRTCTIWAQQSDEPWTFAQPLATANKHHYMLLLQLRWVRVNV